MNCKSFQEGLDQYLDGTLSPGKKAAAQKHAAQCNACRDAVRRERHMSQFLVLGLEEMAKPLVVDSELQSRIAAALNRKLSIVPREIFFGRLWKRLALPLAAGAAVLVIVGFFGGHFFPTRSLPQAKAARIETGAHQETVSFELSYCVPTYTSRQEVGFVTDAITCEPRDLNGVLLVRN